MTDAISLYDLVECLSRAMDLVDNTLVNHHKRVAYISQRIAAELGMAEPCQNRLILAGLLHDSGALSLGDRLEALRFEISYPQRHSEVGYNLLASYPPFADLANMVRYHHVPWKHGQGQTCENREVPKESHIIHLADRIAVLMGQQKDVIGESYAIREEIKAGAGELFVPEHVEAFLSLASQEAFWLYASAPPNFARSRQWPLIEREEQFGLAQFFGRVIDFRSSFTATHSSGVAESAAALAELMGMPEAECRKMKLAGYLHDLGKLAIPTEILEKPDTLTVAERNVIRSHTFHTFTILDAIPQFHTIKTWAAFHHERLNGEGYPFRLKEGELSLGARIMAVADVFTAITEDRPYRKGMSETQALKVLTEMVKNRVLDGQIVETLQTHFGEIDQVRKTSQNSATAMFRTIETTAI